MTVENLIKELQQLNPSSEVYINLTSKDGSPLGESFVVFVDQTSDNIVHITSEK